MLALEGKLTFINIDQNYLKNLYGKQIETGKIVKFCCDYKDLEEVADK